MTGQAARWGIGAAYAAFALLSLTVGFTILPYEWIADGPRAFFPLELLDFVLDSAGVFSYAAAIAVPLLLGLGAGTLAYGAARGRPWAWVVTVGILALLAAGSLLSALQVPQPSHIRGAPPDPTPLVRAANVLVALLCAWGARALHRARRDEPVAEERLPA